MCNSAFVIDLMRVDLCAASQIRKYLLIAIKVQAIQAPICHGSAQRRFTVLSMPLLHPITFQLLSASCPFACLDTWVSRGIDTVSHKAIS